MSNRSLFSIFGLALVLVSGVQAYDPVPDPRLSRSPPSPGASQPRSVDRDDDDDVYGTLSGGGSTRRGEPQFGTSSRRRIGDGGYGGGYQRGR